MTIKTTIQNFSRMALLGFFALVLAAGFATEASASCQAFPKIPLWKTLTHDFARRHVDEKYDGDWQAYIEKLRRYQVKLRAIYDRGSAADISWKNRKIRLKGDAIPGFLKLVDRRISVTRCLAENRADIDDIANFSTAAGGTDSRSFDETSSRQCAPIPKVDWWKFKTHQGISGYVSRKFRGNWGKYIDSWNRRFAKLQNIRSRGASAVTSTGVTLRGTDLSAYMDKMQKRISITRCLSEKAVAART